MIEGLRWAGERAFLVEFPSLDEVLAFRARVVADPLGQVDQVAAARTVLLTFATSAAARRAAAVVGDADLSPVPAGERDVVDIDVAYDGEDLGEVAALTGLSREAVVQAHTASDWTAAFGGFAPGFAYLTGGDPRLRVPRLDTPRTAVPAGSVAIAGEFSAVYPRRSPGGWRLIGRTDAPLWDLDREEPALIRPGDIVRFRPVRSVAMGGAESAPAPAGLRNGAERHRRGVVTSPRHPDPGSAAADGAGTSAPPSALAVLAPGPLSLIEDLGRPGLADLGVSASGAADTASARRANRIVGNARAAAVVETTFGGLAVRAVGDQVVALAGADTNAVVTTPAGDVAARPGAAFLLRDGDTLTLGVPASGVRSYLAVRGGVDVPEVLGSRSADRLSAIGPAPLRAGDTLFTGAAAVSAVGGPEHGAPAGRARRDDQATRLRIRFGPRDDRFAPAERRRLVDQAWVVGTQSDRVGVRLEPAPGSRPLQSRGGELPSEGVVAGAIQVPPSGHPVVFGPDHPVTGGYPVIAVVETSDLPALAQCRPGATIRFRAAPDDR